MRLKIPEYSHILNHLYAKYNKNDDLFYSLFKEFLLADRINDSNIENITLPAGIGNQYVLNIVDAIKNHKITLNDNKIVQLIGDRISSRYEHLRYLLGDTKQNIFNTNKIN